MNRKYGSDPPGRRMAFVGYVELNNGIVLKWLRFSESKEEAIQLVIDQHVHVARCWVE